MTFRQSIVTVAVVIAASLLACASAIAKPLPPREGCRSVSKIEYNAAKREYLLRSKVRVYIRTGPFWQRHYWPIGTSYLAHQADCVVTYPLDDVMVFRNPDTNALRKLCRQLRWEIIRDTSLPIEDL
jgi:hypothetical protein